MHVFTVHHLGIKDASLLAADWNIQHHSGRSIITIVYIAKKETVEN